MNVAYKAVLNPYTGRLQKVVDVAAMGGAANGLATLDTNGEIPAEQMPAISITDTFVVASQAEMLALTAQVGDIAIRTDIGKTYVLAEDPASTLGNWKELLFATPDLSPYWKSDGTSTATGNWDLGTRTLSAGGLYISGSNPILQLTGDETNDTNGGTLHFRSLAGAENFYVVFNAQTNAFTFTYGTNTLLSLGQTSNVIQTPSASSGGVETLKLTSNTWTNSSLVQKMISGSVTLNQSGTAGFDFIDIDFTQTAVGSGEKNLIRFNRTGSGVFTVNYQGAVTLNKSMTTTPSAMLDIVTVGTYADTIPAILAGKAVTSGNSLGASFRNLTGTTGNAMIEIAGIISGSARVGHIRTDSAGNMSFHTGSTSYGTLGTQRLFIAQGGNVSVGSTTSTTHVFQIQSTSSNQFALKYDGSNYLDTRVFSNGAIYYNAVGSLPYHEFRLNGSFKLQINDSVSYFSSNTSLAIFGTGADVGFYLGAGYYNTFEIGLYGQNADEAVALYDQNTYQWYYFNRALYGSDSAIYSTAQFNVVSTLGNQLYVGYDFTYGITFNIGSSAYMQSTNQDLIVQASTGGTYHLYLRGGDNYDATAGSVNISGGVDSYSGAYGDVNIQPDNGYTNIGAGTIITYTDVGTVDHLAFFGGTPIEKVTTSITAGSFVVGAGVPVNDNSTFEGYTLKQIAKALVSYGLLN